jgi:hypothetical protein
MNTNNKIDYFTLKFLSVLVCLMGLNLPISILNTQDNTTTIKIIFAYCMLVLLPLASMRFLYQLIKSESYKSVYPFKWFD